MATASITSILGAGSGIDTTALVSQLVEAQFANKNAQITKKEETLTAQISKLAELKSGISDFSAALNTLTSSGELKTQPTSSHTNILTIASTPGSDVTGTSAQLEVRQLAQAQVASVDPMAGGASTVVGTGTLTLTWGTAVVSGGTMTSFTAGSAPQVAITIDAAHDTLQGVADAINAANAGISASILSDSSGARLVVKGQTGSNQAFQLKGSSQLTELDIGRNETGSTIDSVAQNAIVAVDGVQVTRASNTIYDLVEGTRIDLVSAAVGTKVTIGTKAPTEVLRQSVTNYVDTYNEIYKMVKAAVNPIDGPLRGDPAAKDLLRQLRQITLTALVEDVPVGSPDSLSGIGVGTQRDGTLLIDAARLSTALSTYPAQVEAMFKQSAGLAKALSEIATKALDKTTGLGASEANYAKAQTRLEDEKDKALAAAETLRARMTQQFASMDAKVAAYKSTQSFLTQQVAAWNKD